MTGRTCILCERSGVHFNDDTINVCAACASPEAIRAAIERIPNGQLKASLLRIGLENGLVDEREGDRTG